MELATTIRRSEILGLERVRCVANKNLMKGIQMKLSEYKSYDELPLFLNAATVAKVLGVSPSSGYELMHVVGTSSASLASGQGRKLVRSTVPPLPTKPKGGFVGNPFCWYAYSISDMEVLAYFSQGVCASVMGIQLSRCRLLPGRTSAKKFSSPDY